ncbi:MAG: hypothetical protein M1826_006370 [Phylliscum demangeonii]|nr:MAG: hypothetical protein M1826_006370 [Phylliscum demangeonii]
MRPPTSASLPLLLLYLTSSTGLSLAAPLASFSSSDLAVPSASPPPPALPAPVGEGGLARRSTPGQLQTWARTHLLRLPGFAPPSTASSLESSEAGPEPETAAELHEMQQENRDWAAYQQRQVQATQSPYERLSNSFAGSADYRRYVRAVTAHGAALRNRYPGRAVPVVVQRERIRYERAAFDLVLQRWRAGHGLEAQRGPQSSTSDTRISSGGF